MSSGNIATNLLESCSAIDYLRSELNTEKNINNTLREKLEKSIHEVIDSKHTIKITGFNDRIRISRIKQPFTKTELEHIIEVLGLNDYSLIPRMKDLNIDFYSDNEMESVNSG